MCLSLAICGFGGGGLQQLTYEQPEILRRLAGRLREALHNAASASRTLSSESVPPDGGLYMLTGQRLGSGGSAAMTLVDLGEVLCGMR